MKSVQVGAQNGHLEIVGALLVLVVDQFEEVFTLVDFYQYIKGVEYLICIAFFAGFPMFYRYIHGSK